MTAPFLKHLFAALLLLAAAPAAARSTRTFADSIRKAARIPELGYAVVSSTGTLVCRVTGVRQIHTGRAAGPDDRFRIGSNTKTVTGMIAALLVQQGKIRWDTRFFDLFPQLQAASRPEHHRLTLLDLLTFRTQLFPYTYTYPEPAKAQFTGTEAQQRYQFLAWALRQPPVGGPDSIHFSNLGYVAAGLMLEKAAGKSYRELVAGLGRQLGISFGFGNPNTADPAQPWGHDAQLRPEPPGDSYKLSWLQAAGNLNCSLPGYARFIREQLAGLKGRSALLPKETYAFLHFGRPRVAVGWFQQRDGQGRTYSWHTGNPGAFLTQVYLFPELDRAFILFANAQTDDAAAGLDALYRELLRRYCR